MERVNEIIQRRSEEYTMPEKDLVQRCNNALNVRNSTCIYQCLKIEDCKDKIFYAGTPYCRIELNREENHSKYIDKLREEQCRSSKY